MRGRLSLRLHRGAFRMDYHASRVGKSAAWRVRPWSRLSQVISDHAEQSVEPGPVQGRLSGKRYGVDTDRMNHGHPDETHIFQFRI